ncbi:MAG TPA: response regulator transcription factor [Blastocatellia bacterium]|nr:response regulator transcription factor [Blastocatellia bacterium]
MANEIQIVLADDHPIVRRGLRLTIESDPSLQVVAEANDGQEALDQIRTRQPAIAVIDINMPRMDGLGVARELQKSRLEVGIVFLTLHSEEDLLHEAMDLGAKGYILKESAVTEIVNGIKSVAGGQYYVTPSLTGHLLHRRQRAQRLTEAHTSLSSLTPTERRILQLVAGYKSSKEIAAELFIHYRTVENHRTNICQKLGLSGRNSLFKFAMQQKGAL